MNKRRIMIVEDESIISEDIKRTLIYLGYDVVATCPSGEVAIPTAEELLPELILMDIKLEGELNGIQTAEAIYQKHGIPIIFLTSYSNDKTLEGAALSEPYGYILKPFEERELHATIEMAFYKHKMQKELRSKEKKYRDIFENAIEAIFVIKGDYFHFFNNKMIEYTGFSEEELKLKPFFEIIHPEDRILAISNYRRRIQQEEVSNYNSYRFIGKNNEVRWMKINSVLIDWEGETATLNFMSDETEQKLAQIKQKSLVEKLERVNVELKDFAYIVSHDLKAPLRAISSLANWISTDYAENFDEDGKEQMKLLISRVKRMHNLIVGILEYSRVGRIKEEIVNIDLNEIVSEAIDIISPPDHINVEIVGELPEIKFERTRIDQVFQNLISNAVKFNDKEHGIIKISSSDDTNNWKFEVNDNGPGVEKRHFDRIFKIFQTLQPRDEFESTGVGLTLIKKIIEQYDGKIWIESVVGKGTTFIFTIPKVIELENLDEK